MEQFKVVGKTITLWMPGAGNRKAGPDYSEGTKPHDTSGCKNVVRTHDDGTASAASSIDPTSPTALPLVYLNCYAGDGHEIWKAHEALDCAPFTLAVISGLDWNRELSPWECDGTVRDAEPFAGGAGAYLEELLGEILPAVEHRLPTAPAWRGIAGYSLAGLFALWSLWHTGAFSRAASASGSLWFPGFVERAGEEPFAGSVEAAYLSLGKKETRTPNRMMRHVLEDTQRMEELLCSRDIPCTFELNPGNHFSQTDERMARGIAWILKA